MIRCPLLWIAVEQLYDVAVAMADGSYWKEEAGNRADEFSYDVSNPAFWE